MKLLLLLLICTSVHARQRGQRIEFGPSTTSKLSQVLLITDELSTALVQKQDSQVILKIKALQMSLHDAIKVSDPDKQNKSHLDRILNEAASNLEKWPVSRGDEKKNHLQSAFRQLVLIGQTYKVPEKYNFYFCSKDRSVWLQAASKPNNPINPETLKTCGTRVE